MLIGVIRSNLFSVSKITFKDCFVSLVNVSVFKVLVFSIFLFSPTSQAQEIPSSQRSKIAIKNVTPSLKKSLQLKNMKLGSAVFIRIFKSESKLEVWLENPQKQFELFKTYPICTYSGELGPKLKEGDKQSPEGFYFVKPNQLNPYSRFHLSFNLGYPNSYDRAHNRTGSALMVHGNCVSIGCYAMTDPQIEEIYALMNAAFDNAQPFIRVHAFPFKFTANELDTYKNHQWHGFWQNLKQGFDYFETHNRPPNVTVSNGLYRFD